jgi:ubiquinone/menaquinone biosynthesis C-methylase UbiE
MRYEEESMPTLDWLQHAFSSGYDSGNVLSLIPGARRRSEERHIGASYRKVFFRAILPYIKADSVVLELGPGRGSWSRAILKYIPQGELHTVDFQDVTVWLQPDRYRDRLFCHQISDNSFSGLKDAYFDFLFIPSCHGSGMSRMPGAA